jgi:hypothetical protein
MFKEEMVADVDVLGAGTQLGKPCQSNAPALSSKTLQ